MFRSKHAKTVIGDGLKIQGHVAAEGVIEVNGQIEGDLHCTSLIVSSKAQIVGSIIAERVVVNGKVEGPIQGGEVVLKSQAHVVGDIHHQSLTIERAPTLMAARNKSTEQMDANPTKGLFKGTARQMLQLLSNVEGERPTSFAIRCPAHHPIATAQRVQLTAALLDIPLWVGKGHFRLQ